MLLSTAAVATVILCTPGSAFAQDTAVAQTDDTTIVVTGIRKGLEDSIVLKRQSTSIIEAISAEDIGKLPDVSIAESLVRLPGLAGQRVNGHAQVISIRGLSPDFSTTLLNGRMQVSTGDNRAAEFDQYPSELINSAQVYKTPDAGLIGQGLSGTVNLNTIQPLQFKDRVLSVGVRGSVNSQDKLNADSKVNGNRLNFTYVDQFLDGKVGVALAYAHLDDPTQTKHSKSWWWDGLGNDSVTGAPRLGAGKGADMGLNGVEIWNDSRFQKRDGYMGIVEFKPNDNFHSINDLYYSKFDQTDKIRGAMWYQSQWADDLHISNPTFATIGGSEVNTGATFSGVAPIVRGDYNSRQDTMVSLGSNNTWHLGEWDMLADLGYSKADRKEMISETYAGYGTSPTTGSRIFDSVAEKVSFGGFPSLDPSLNYADATKVYLGDAAPWGGWGHDGAVRYPHVKDELATARFAGSHNLSGGVFSSVDLGVDFSKRTKEKTVDEFDLCLKGAPASDCHGTRVAVAGNNLVGASDLSWANFGGLLAYNVPSVIATYYDKRAIKDENNYNKFWKVQEDLTTAYAKVNIDTHALTIPVRGNIGLQIVDQKQSATGFTTSNIGGAVKFKQFEKTTSYTDALPSANLIFDVADATMVRVGVAKQMARPRMDDLRANSSAGVSILGKWSGSGGNPNLKPWRATAYDLSVEHYFSKSSYIAAAWFYKSMDTYIRNTTDEKFDFTGYPNLSGTPALSTIGSFATPENGSGGHVEGIELSGSIEGSLVSDLLDGFGAIGSISRGWTDIHAGDSIDPAKLPGFSGTVTNTTFYYEKHGFSARVSERRRSAELGETTQLFANRAATRIMPDKQLDAQISYDISTGPLKGMTLLAQANNLTNSAYRTQLKVSENKLASGTSFPEVYETYGTTYIFGFNYKFH
jgi:iron complex outermembrane receptor protein